MLSTIQSLQPDTLYHKQCLRGKNKALPILRAAFSNSTDVSLTISEKLCPTLQPYLRYLTLSWDWETRHLLANLPSHPLCHQHSKAIHPFFRSLSQKRVISEKPLPYTLNILQTPNGLIPFSRHPGNERFHSLSPNGLVSKIQA